MSTEIPATAKMQMEISGSAYENVSNDVFPLQCKVGKETSIRNQSSMGMITKVSFL